MYQNEKHSLLVALVEGLFCIVKPVTAKYRFVYNQGWRSLFVV